MRRLFRSFEKHGLRYLLISGQASVLYGAATFSEDVDIWIDPDEENALTLLRALAGLHAQVYKLTPPLTGRNMRAGHGFHFIVPGRPLPIYLDVMAHPPRVGAFQPALRRARRMKAEGVEIPVVCQEDLVKLKLTQRFSDYEIISRLVNLRVAEVDAGRGRKAVLRWAVQNTFHSGDRATWLKELGRPRQPRLIDKDISRQVARFQAQDRRYWNSRIDGLRRFFREGTLLPRGTPVAEVLQQIEKT